MIQTEEPQFEDFQKHLVVPSSHFLLQRYLFFWTYYFFSFLFLFSLSVKPLYMKYDTILYINIIYYINIMLSGNMRSCHFQFQKCYCSRQYICTLLCKPSPMTAADDGKLATNPVVVNSRASRPSLRSITLITACASSLVVPISCQSTTMASTSVCHFVVIHVYRRIGRLSALLQVQVITALINFKNVINCKCVLQIKLIYN